MEKAMEGTVEGHRLLEVDPTDPEEFGKPQQGMDALRTAGVNPILWVAHGSPVGPPPDGGG